MKINLTISSTKNNEAVKIGPVVKNDCRGRSEVCQFGLGAGNILGTSWTFGAAWKLRAVSPETALPSLIPMWNEGSGRKVK